MNIFYDKSFMITGFLKKHSFGIFLLAGVTVSLLYLFFKENSYRAEFGHDQITGDSCISEPVFPFRMHSPEIITRLPTHDSVIALTFDACESVTPSYFDTAVLHYIIRNELPATLFISGKFARRNEPLLNGLSELPFIEIENHSHDHAQHMERLTLPDVFADVERARGILDTIAPVKTRFFRFPGGNHDRRSLLAVNQMMYSIVHWTFPSGDADPLIPGERIIEWNVSQARPGAIMIFHVNGRGYKTRNTLPVIVEELRNRGYRFALLRDYL